MAQLFGLFASLFFLGQAFTIMLVYIWSRRNPYIRMNFFGLLNFQAPFLPWVLMGFSLLLGNSIIIDLLGKGGSVDRAVGEEGMYPPSGFLFLLPRAQDWFTRLGDQRGPLRSDATEAGVAQLLCEWLLYCRQSLRV